MSRDAKERFRRIHKHYDFFNHLFSLGTDIKWRREAARESVIGKGEYSVLDIATGTGDLAIAVNKAAESNGKSVKITGMDFSPEMLGHARSKIKRLGMGNIVIEKGDALHTKYGDASFDVVTSGFALRNFDSLERFSKELKRVMKKGGKFVLLDMAMPYRGVVVTKFYFRLMDAVGSLVNRNAYHFLTYSIMHFDKGRMVAILRERGFKNVKLRNMTSGMAFIITGNK